MVCPLFFLGLGEGKHAKCSVKVFWTSPRFFAVVSKNFNFDSCSLVADILLWMAIWRLWHTGAFMAVESTMGPHFRIIKKTYTTRTNKVHKRACMLLKCHPIREYCITGQAEGRLNGFPYIVPNICMIPWGMVQISSWLSISICFWNSSYIIVFTSIREKEESKL